MRTHRFRATAAVAVAATLLATAAAVAHEGEHEDGEVMLITAVVPGSAAEAAGLAAGDRILTWDGQSITTQQELGAFLDSHLPGDRISLSVSREGRTMVLPLTFGERADGGVSIGLSLGVGQGSSKAESEGFSAEECLAWVDETFRMASMAQAFELELAAEIEKNRACMDRDTQRMALPIPQTWCDNVFKVHCSGLDLLAEIGDALVAKCESDLSASLGEDISRNESWNVCGEQKVFDRYSMRGEVSDVAACRRLLVDECGAELGD